MEAWVEKSKRQNKKGTEIGKKKNQRWEEMPHITIPKKDEAKGRWHYLCGQKNETKEEKDSKGNCIRKERYTGTCNRSFYVGEQVTQDDIHASFKDGILSLQVPKDIPKVEDSPKLITIE